MDEVCSECQSINFKNEKPSDGKFTLCCHKGKVKLEPLEPYPELLKALLTDKKHPNYANFIENIRSYNSALAFASMGASIAPQQIVHIVSEFMVKFTTEHHQRIHQKVLLRSLHNSTY
jgi:hypothetical protein